MSPEKPERAGGLHPVYGRHYQRGVHPDLARSQRVHHKSALLLAGLDAVMREYEGRIVADGVSRFHDRVLSQLRRSLRDEWTTDDAVACAMHLAGRIASEG